MATTGAKRSVVVGVFGGRSEAQRCVDELRRAGFREDQIGVAGRDADGAAGTSGATDSGTASSMVTGAATGVATGAGVGALWALGIVAGVLPAIGPAIAGGVLASILSSAAAGGAVAGLVGALVGLGLSEDEAQYYEGEFKAGKVIVTVKAEGRYDEANAIVRRHGAYDMHERTPVATATAATATHAHSHTHTHTHAHQPATGQAAGGTTVRLHEEHLHAQKQAVQTGEVSVRKEVVTEHKTLTVPVEREEVVITRKPVSGHATSGEIRQGEEIRIPVKEEHVHVSKDTVVKEEVSVGKRKVHDTETVSGTVRKEELRVEEKGDVQVHGDVSKTPRK